MIPAVPILRRIPRGTVSLEARGVAAALGGLLARPARAARTVREFEAAFAAALGVRHAIAVASGKAALALILRSLGARPGDGVVVGAWNVPEVVSLLRGLGLRPRLVDADPDHLGPDLAAVPAAVDGGTRFLLATHLYGCPLPMDAVRALAQRHGLQVIEDGAQALGAASDGRAVGAQGCPALFSFGPLKSLNTLGGGMVTTDDDGLAARARATLAGRGPSARAAVLRALATSVALRALTGRTPFSLLTWPALRAADRLAPRLAWRLAKGRPAAWESGWLDPDRVLAPLGPAAAALGLAGLPQVAVGNERRAANAERLRAALDGTPGLRCPRPAPGTRPVWTNFVVRVPDRETLRRSLLARGVDTTPGYLVATQRLVPGAPASFPVAAALERENLYLPVGPELDGADMDRLAALVRAALRDRTHAAPSAVSRP